MAKKFDATAKTLLEESPVDWPLLAGFRAGRVEVVDADVSTVTGAADKVLRINDKQPWIMHVDFQAGPDASIPRRVHGYNGVLGDRLEEVLGMEESVTYQAIVAKGRQQGIEIGRIEEARDMLLRVGKKRFKKAAPAQLRKQIGTIEDRRELENLLERVLDASKWDELLTPQAP